MLKRLLAALRVFGMEYKPLIEVRIFKQKLLDNLHRCQQLDLQIAPVLKSNAYGHGLGQVAKIFDGENLPFFVVDSFYEALFLRTEGIKTKVLILGFTTIEQIKQKLPDVSFGITSLENLRQITAQLHKPTNFHLKIDTGMHRQGILPEEVKEAIGLIKSNPNILLEGICTHFAAAGENRDFTMQQISEWNAQVKIFRSQFSGLKYFHASNTAGLGFTSQIDANVARVGIGLYQSTLEMRAVVSVVKGIKKGDKVGYELTFEANQDMKIATVPVGYFEGVDRRLSNKRFFKVRDVFCPIVGLLSMNMATIDVSGVSEVKLGEQVVVISADSADKNSIKNIASTCGCTEYEILVHIPQHLRRLIV